MSRMKRKACASPAGLAIAAMVIAQAVAGCTRPAREPGPVAEPAAPQPAVVSEPGPAAPDPVPARQPDVRDAAEALVDDAARKALDDEWAAAGRLTEKGAKCEGGLHVTAVTLWGNALRDADLADLRRMPHLKALVVADGNTVSPELFSDGGAEHLATAQSIERLEVPGTSFDDDGCKVVRRLTSLTVLDLSRTRVTDEGLRWLSTLKALDRLVLSGAERVSGRGLAPLVPALKGLRVLDLRGVDLGTDDLALVGRFTSLEELYLPDVEPEYPLGPYPLHGAPPTSWLGAAVPAFKPLPARRVDYAAGLKHLAGLVKLKSPAMTKVVGEYSGRKTVWDRQYEETPLSDCLGHQLIRDLKEESERRRRIPVEQAIVGLYVREPAGWWRRKGEFNTLGAEFAREAPFLVRPPGSVLEHIAGYENVTSLDLTPLLVGDQDLRHLQGFTRLERLDLTGQPVTGAGLMHLSRLPIKYLNLRGTNIDDEQLQVLWLFPKLKDVVVSQTDVSEEGLKPFRRGTLRAVFHPDQKRPAWCGVDWRAAADNATAGRN